MRGLVRSIWSMASSKSTPNFVMHWSHARCRSTACWRCAAAKMPNISRINALRSKWKRSTFVFKTCEGFEKARISTLKAEIRVHKLHAQGETLSFLELATDEKLQKKNPTSHYIKTVVVPTIKPH